MIYSDTVSSFFVPTIGILASVVTASLSYYFAKVQQIRNENRKIKEEFYRNFMNSMSALAIDNSDEKARKEFAQSVNTLTLIASKEVVKKLLIFYEFISEKNRVSMQGQLDVRVKKHDELLTEDIKEMRRDLFYQKDIEADFPLVHLVSAGPRSS